MSPGAIEAPQAARVVPDWTVQYGQVTNPHGSSGSFGAMLEGRNLPSEVFYTKDGSFAVQPEDANAVNAVYS